MMRTGPTVGLAVQVVLLVILASTVGLGEAGWVAGLGFAVAGWVLLTWAMTVTGVRAFGPADWVTLTRATLVGCVTALVADSLHRPVRVSVLVTITAVALALDFVDGQVARGTRTASAFGARFDGELDAFLILVLSVFVSVSLGSWVIVIGAMRYGFLVLGWVLNFMRRPLPYRYWRKVVAAVQGIVLVVVAAGVLPQPVEALAVAGALLMLVESFGRDVAWLWFNGVVEPAASAQPRRS
jgi:phosphatidylglycerophosphate synthase